MTDRKYTSSFVSRIMFCFVKQNGTFNCRLPVLPFFSPLPAAGLAPSHVHFSLHNISFKMWVEEKEYGRGACTPVSIFCFMSVAWTMCSSAGKWEMRFNSEKLSWLFCSFVQSISLLYRAVRLPQVLCTP